MSKKVRAVIMPEQGKIEIGEFPYPEHLEDGAMIVRPIMSGICGTDKHAYRGESVQYAGTEREISGPYPAIPGHENVAVVVEITPKARREMEFYGETLSEGDRVVISPDIVCGHCYQCRHGFHYTWCENIESYGHMKCDAPPHLFGGWAEYMYINPGSHVYKVPSEVSDEIAVLSEPMAVAYSLDKLKEISAIPKEGFNFGDTVVIQGVGPLGMCHLIKACMLGAGNIIAVDRSEYRLNMALQFGADYVFNVEKTTQEERVARVKEMTSGRGVDLVIECVGSPKVLPEGLEMLRQGGTYLETGNFVDTGTVEINPHRHLCAKNVRLIGMTNLCYTGYLPSMKMMHRYSKWYPFEDLVTHRYPIDEALTGLLKSMELDSMKVVIVPQNDFSP